MPSKSNRAEVAERINLLVILRREGKADWRHQRELANILLPRIRLIQGLIKTPDTALVEREDMIQEGVVAAYRAMDRWDPEGADFTTFAFGRIRGAMYDYMRTVDRLPRPVRVQLAKIKVSSQRIEQRDSSGTVSLGDLSEDTGLSEDSIRDAVSMSKTRYHASIFDRGFNDDDESAELLSSIASDDTVNTQSSDLRRALDMLDARELSIVEDFYLRDMVQQDIAIRNNLTEARISQIRNKGLQRVGKSLIDSQNENE